MQRIPKINQQYIDNKWTLCTFKFLQKQNEQIHNIQHIKLLFTITAVNPFNSNKMSPDGLRKAV